MLKLLGEGGGRERERERERENRCWWRPDKDLIHGDVPQSYKVGLEIHFGNHWFRWGCVRSTLRLRPQPLTRSQPSTTVRNRSREGRMAVPMVSSAEGFIFGGFKRLVVSFRVVGVALCDIQTCFVTCRKSFCVAGTILLRCFQKMRCSFRGRRSTLEMCWQLTEASHETSILG